MDLIRSNQWCGESIFAPEPVLTGSWVFIKFNMCVLCSLRLRFGRFFMGGTSTERPENAKYKAGVNPVW